jgi:hypothetical protein
LRIKEQETHLIPHEHDGDDDDGDDDDDDDDEVLATPIISYLYVTFRFLIM